MNPLSLTPTGLDAPHLARGTGAPPPPAGARALGRPDAGAETGAQVRSAFLLASLYTRLDDAYALAKAERSGGGDPSGSQQERLRKLYPPYPAAFQERAAYLDHLAGVGKTNQSLQWVAEEGMENDAQGERLARQVAGQLAAMPATGLARQPVQFLRTNLESEA